MIIDYYLIGQRIRTIRKQKNLTQEQLAERLNVSIVYISQIENGKTRLSLEMLVNISSLLDCEAGELLSGATLNPSKSIPHELSTVLQSCPPKKLKLITELAKLIDKY